jgi:RimJ/RimL family protein N-acetyltransferase
VSQRPRRTTRGRGALCALLVLGAAAPARGDREPPPPVALQGSWFAFGAQTTEILQGNPPIRSPYSNPALSFGPGASLGWSLTASIFGAVAPWRGAWIIGEREYANGRGLPNASGLAGYPNGEIVRVPALGKQPYLARVFYHQDFPLTAARVAEPAEFEARFAPAGAHPPGATVAPSRLELTLGKLAMNDFIDVSQVASDPRLEDAMLYGQRLRLRLVDRGDLPRYVSWIGDPEIRRNLLLILPLSLEREEQWFQAQLQQPLELHPFSVERPIGEDWEHTGGAGLTNLDWRSRSVAIGLFIGEKALWGQGLGTEITELLLTHAFDVLNLHRVHLRVFADNPRAVRVYEKAGFTAEGRQRDAGYRDGAYRDVLLYSVLRREWAARR